MSLVSRLLAFLAGGSAPEDEDAIDLDERLAGAALLVHVARVDGRVAEAERLRLAELFRGRFGLDADAAERLIARAERVDRATDDVATLIDVIGRDAPEAERRRLLGMAYAVAAADGTVAEFEEDLVWRLGHLLGFDADAINAIRAEAVRDVPAPAGS